MDNSLNNLYNNIGVKNDIMKLPDIKIEPVIEKPKVSNKPVKFTITMFENDELIDICLNDFNKTKITFGRGEENDITLSSSLVSLKHGYFELINNELKIYDNNSKNGLLVNNVQIKSTSLKDGDSIKIDNVFEPLYNGVIMIVTTGEKESTWLQYNLNGKDLTTIGRGNDCDIVLDRISIYSHHAKITKHKDKYYLSGYANDGGIILNGFTLRESEALKDRDVILINNIKLIYNREKIIYQMNDTGVTLEAIDIVKTVKVKGKKKDIAYHVNFEARPKEFIAFVGGSGAGKSTFLKCISGVNRPTSGKVLLNGESLFSNYQVLKNLIGYVPQEDIVFDDLTLIDMLRYAANLRMPDDATYIEKENRINAVLGIVELSDKKDVMIRSLSGGQRKRASIAIELIADPKLFFLDEPTSGLDPGTERIIMKTLRKMANSGKTIILVTHNTLNLHLCDKVVFFGRGGKLCFDGAPEDALKFFNVTDFVDIYNLLNDNSDNWYKKFKEYNNKKEIVEDKIKDERQDTKSKFSLRTNHKSFFKQFITLSKRQLKKLFNNQQQLVLLLFQAPLIAYLLSLIVTKNLFYSYEETKSILFSIATSAVWLGLLNSIQEICKERVILEKEYMADLKLSSYLASKVFYLCLLAIAQAILFVGVFNIFVDVPQNGVIFPWKVETILTVFITIISASSIGLVVSTFSKNSSVALTYAPILLVPQLLFSGMLFPLEGTVDVISNFILCRWSVEALGTTNDLNSLVSAIQEIIPGYVRDAETYYTFTAAHFRMDLLIILLMMIILMGAGYIILKKQLGSGK